MATEESTPVSVAAAVTVLPAFDKPAAGPRAPKLTLLRRRPDPAHADTSVELDAAEPEVTVPDTAAELVDLGAAELSVPVALPVALPVQAEAPAVELVAEPMSAEPMSAEPTAAEPTAAEPIATHEPSSADLQEALRQALERAEAAEAANAVLRRKVAALDDELAGFRPRAIVPFEDNTD